ncbi:MAG: amino acid adenylation domain-containing protein [Clostridia bacterium]|nr:amino acid adenylation domain-containing protein [Clostridia bacterium]
MEKCLSEVNLRDTVGFAVSPVHQRLYVMESIRDCGVRFNNSFAMAIEGALDVERLKTVFQELVAKHEILRSSFHIENGELIRRIDDVEFDLALMECNDSNSDDIVNGFLKPFKLDKGPLFRAGLVKVSEGRHVMVLDAHSIICDSLSLKIIMNNVIKAYNRDCITTVEMNFRDNIFGEYSATALDSSEYWYEKFRGEVPLLNMPSDYSRMAVQSFEGDSISLTLPREIVLAFDQSEYGESTSMYTALLAVYNVLLYKYTGQENITVGLSASGRRSADQEGEIGVFENTLPSKNYISGSKTFNEFLADVRNNTREAYKRSDYRFEDLLTRLKLPMDLSRNSLFDVAFEFENHTSLKVQTNNLMLSPYKMDGRTAKCDISLKAIIHENGVNLNFIYSTKLFKKETMQRLAEHFTNIMEKVAQNPQIKLDDVCMLSEAEKNQLVFGFNNTDTEYPREMLLHELFEKQVLENGERTAVVFEDKSLTYAELNEKANKIARVLRQKGVGKDKIVGLMLERSLEMIIGIFAVLKAGGAYVPIDPEYPTDRVEFMLEDSGTGILLTQGSLATKVNFNGEVVDMEDEELYQGGGSNLERVNTPDSLAYVIYTSGSTGRPKGVMLEHRSVSNFIKGINDLISFSPDSTMISVTTICFDIFVLEIFVTLTYGAKVVIANKFQQSDPRELSKAIIEHNVDMIQTTPSRIQMLTSSKRSKMECFKKLKVIMVGGEAFPDTLLENLSKVTSARVFNMYGPTETTVWSTVKELTGESKITIGTPIANTRVYFVDKNNKMQPIGIPGELCIAGDGLARGYLNRPELTAEKFVPDPAIDNAKMYKTGDLARWLDDGSIEFLGRLDHQVKIRGFRIELDEIRAQMMSDERIKEAVVTARDDSGGNKYICAYYISDTELTISQLKAQLAEKLPDYMIPAFFVRLDKMPQTPNGKVDRKALPDPDSIEKLDWQEQSPQNEVEETLADICGKALNLNNLCVNKSLIEYGADSLKLIYIYKLVNDRYPGKLKIGDIFTYLEISKLAKLILN